MAVLTVAHILLLDVVKVQRAREATGRLLGFAMVGRHQRAEVVGDHAVVSGGVFKRLDSQIETGGVLQ
ncbi:hypothetical protein D3C71_1435210 [compost metagenome]